MKRAGCPRCEARRPIALISARPAGQLGVALRSAQADRAEKRVTLQKDRAEKRVAGGCRREDEAAMMH